MNLLLLCRNVFRSGLIVIGADIYCNVIRFVLLLVMIDRQLEKATSVFEKAFDIVYSEF